MEKFKLPGDLSQSQYIEECIRVNHAGEYGAKKIYEGQLKFTKDPEIKSLLNHMLTQELNHLTYFEEELIKRKIRPTALTPLWSVSGYILGAVTAVLGTKASMICTEAIEEVINQHYQDQIDYLPESEFTLKVKIQHFQQEEMEHHHIAAQKNTEPSLFYNSLKFFISQSCKIAIKIAKKI